MTVVRQSIFVVPEIVEVARQRGLFDAEDLDVQDVMTQSSTAQQEDFAAGHIDLAITSIDNLLAWNTPDAVRTGAGVVLVAQLEDTTDLVLLARSGLSDPSPSEPWRLAVDAPQNGFAVVAYGMLARLGVGRESYEVASHGGVRARYEALLAGTADVTLLAPPLDASGVERGMTPLMRIADFDPRYPGLGVVARRDRLDRDDAVARYLRALEHAAPNVSTPPTSLRPRPDTFAVLADLRATVAMALPTAPDAADLVVDAMGRS